MNTHTCSYNLGGEYPPKWMIAWNSLEGRPRTQDFDRALRAETRDPLWMLSRQWQMGEFEGHDGGSLIFAKYSLKTTRLNRYSYKGSGAVPYNDQMPLETRVEREPMRVDLALRIQMGQEWFRILNELMGELDPGYREPYIEFYGFDVPNEPQDPSSIEDKEEIVAYGIQKSNATAWGMLCAVAGRAMDGWSLYQAILNQDYLQDQIIPDQGLLQAAADLFLTWYDNLYNQPNATLADDAWSPPHLEYQFACSAPDPDAGQSAPIKLVADEYYQGTLDWYSMDLANNGFDLSDQEGFDFNDDVTGHDVHSLIPSGMDFEGMPAPRWWQFESHKVDFGGMDVATTDVSKLLIQEFASTAADNWHIMPFEVPVGTIMDMEGIEVRDCFGTRTYIQHANLENQASWEDWNLFSFAKLDEAAGYNDTRLFVPPAVASNMESEPLEKVSFIRDEMANMVWGVEAIVPNELGGGMDGREASSAFKEFLEPYAEPTNTTPVSNTAKIMFRLGTAMPENWIPFLPAQSGESTRAIRLQRSAMPRDTPGYLEPVVEPRTDLLRIGFDQNPTERYFLNEEEVTKAGTIVQRTWQRARWSNGQTYLWQGRQKKTGKGPGSSGLQFDQLLPKE